MNNDYIEDREILDTKSMLEEGFLKNLGKPIKTKIENAKGELFTQPNIKTANTEKLMLELYDIRDGLIDFFSEVNINSKIAQNLTSNINKIGSCIEKLGGKADKFNPLDHISGLQLPPMIKNAERVIETTKQCYSLGKIKDDKVEDGGNTILITFSGKDGDMEYEARGTVKALKGWAGNEALDYIYSSHEGRLAVKTFENNKWVDKSVDFDIYWELDEKPVEKKGIVAKTENNSEENIGDDFKGEEK